MRAAILSIGDELTLGQGANTNARWLSEQLVARGVLPIEHRTVADDRPAITQAIRELARSCQVVLITGGLGPTQDDLTRDALADVIAPGAELETDPAGIEHLHAMFAKRGRAMPQSNLVQARRPIGTKLLPNPRGTAMGIAATHDGRLIFALPGPPAEMELMFREHVAPAIVPEGGTRVIATAAVHEFGLGEADAAERLGELMRRDRQPLVGTTASHAIVTARIRGEGTRGSIERDVQAITDHVEKAWRPYAFGRDGRTLAEAVGELLRERGETLATAESCTGGLLGASITAVPGSSAYFPGGWVTYSDGCKREQLGVSSESLRARGAVSSEVAREMAAGALAKSRATHAVSITGIAGPDGGSSEKPIGTVYIARATARDGEIRRFLFPGTREQVRDRTVKAALQMLRFALIGAPPGTPLLWEVEARRATTRSS